MHIKMLSPHIERAISPVAFLPEEMLEVPDSFGQKLIEIGHAVQIQPLIAKDKQKSKVFTRKAKK